MKETVMGVYRLYDEKSGVSFIGFTRNLDGIRKRLRFELTLNACSYRPLQEFYNSCQDTMLFEVLEEYHPEAGISDEEIDAHLQAILMRYKATLQARPIQVGV